MARVDCIGVACADYPEPGLIAYVGGDVVQDPAQVIFIISKNPYSTKPTVILNFSTPSLFQVRPAVLLLLGTSANVPP